MIHNYSNDWFFGWSWLLWFGFIFLLFSSFGSWVYTYRVHRKYGKQEATPSTFLIYDMLVEK